MGQFESLDHYGLGLWGPGAEESDFSGWSWEDWDRIAMEDWDALQPAQDAVEADGMRPKPVADRDTSTIRPWDILELEIPEEVTQVVAMLPDLISDSNTPSSTFTKHGTSQGSGNSLASPICDRPTGDSIPKAGSADNATPSADQWLCEHLSCGRVFSHRHKLK